MLRGPGRGSNYLSTSVICCSDTKLALTTIAPQSLTYRHTYVVITYFKAQSYWLQSTQDETVGSYPQPRILPNEAVVRLAWASGNRSGRLTFNGGAVFH